MDFGVAVGFDVSHSDPERLNNKRYGSGADEGDDWGSSKLLKTDIDCNNNSAPKAMLFQQQRSNSLMRSNATLFPSDGHQMLSFSSPKSEPQSTVLHNYFHHPFSDYSRSNSSGYSTSGGGGLHGILSGVRGPFTPSQWMELEHQALIYKYITANVPIPSNLLIPIRKALDSGCGLLRPNTLGWGSYHVGFSGNMDPEPGRCRRTDGKKWRCSRDAVADQKYCERHMNRGRHRSRKPVEGQAPNNSPKLSSTPIAHLNNLRPPAPNRVSMSKEDVCDPKSKNNQFLIPKQQNPFEQASRGEFGLVPSDSLLNPSNKNSTVMSYKSFGSSHDRDSEAQHSLRQFIDDWPKSHSDRSAISWPELDTRLERTQLSISIPMTPNNNNEKVTLSPLRLSREFDPIQMGLGVGSVLDERGNRQANWIPISWETSMGGPLGEVLHNTNSNTMECKNSSSALNLMTEGWDSSPRLGSSPTGVLQKTSFGSLSNSSTGSSPRAHEGASFCNDLLGAPLVNLSHAGRY